MKKIALILGVSTYSNGNNLPACANDTLLIKELLEATDEYEEILCLHKKQTSSKIKQEIVSFLKRYENQNIDQFLFYYTGHGDFDGNEFYYLLGDYEKSKQKQTSIENSELDKWIRLLSPKLTVKIVDACHSGVQYIKDPDAFEKYISSTPKSFKSCYFLFSSQKEEFSFQDQQLSFFTKSLSESVANFSGTEIRFKDIIDYISDDFEHIPNQTPFFITQATSTEIFSKVDDNLKTYIEKCLKKYSSPGKLPSPAKDDKDKKTTLIQLVKEDAEKYCSEHEVQERINLIETTISNFKFLDEIEELYSFAITPISNLHNDVPNLNNIGKWIQENEGNYFAEPTYTTEEYEQEIEVPVKRSISAAYWHSYSYSVFGEPEYRTKTVTKQRNIIDGYKHTYKIENQAFLITAKPKFENLTWFNFHITFIFSKTEICFFYLFSKLKELNWQDRKPQEVEKWVLHICPLKDSDNLKDTIQNIINNFEMKILTVVQEKYLQKTEVNETATSTDENTSQQGAQPDRKNVGGAEANK